MAARNNAKYPWSNWFQRREFRLTEGVDFAGNPEMMRIQVYTAAKRHCPDRRVEVHVDQGTPTVLVVTVAAVGRSKRRPASARC